MHPIALFFLILSTASFAADKPDLWICDVKDDIRPWPQPDEVEVSLQEPLVTLFKYIPQDDGTYRISKKDLITNDTISSWKFARGQCQTQSELRRGEFVDQFDFSFVCGQNQINGTFGIDFKKNTGFFGERLVAHNVTMSLPLVNCRAK